MWFPTHQTEVVHIGEMSCSVGMVIDGRGGSEMSLKPFPKCSCQFINVLLITLLIFHTYTCKSLHFCCLIVSLSLSATRRFLMVFPSLKWTCIPSYLPCLWPFQLIIWCRVLPCDVIVPVVVLACWLFLWLLALLMCFLFFNFNFEPVECPIGKFTPLKDYLNMFLILFW